jgi:hypothetical protein
MRRAFLLLLGFATASGQAQTTLPSNASWHGTPAGPAIGTLHQGTEVSTVRTAGEWTMVTVEGWVASYRLGSRRDTLDRTVIGSGSAPIRAADGPTQRQLGELVPGTVLKRLSERNGWTRVRRSAWLRASALRPPLAAARGDAPPGTPPGVAAATPPPRSADADADAASVTVQRAVRPTSVRANPGGGERATLQVGAVVETLARSGGWARVRIEGWVSENDLMLADTAAGADLSAADLRAAPAAHRGRIVRWEVQVIALQRADPLRRGLALDEPYLLARGPGDENAMLYLALPSELVEQARRIPALSPMTVTARVRDGSSPPVGVPILDVISIARNQ